MPRTTLAPVSEAQRARLRAPAFAASKGEALPTDSMSGCAAAASSAAAAAGVMLCSVPDPQLTRFLCAAEASSAAAAPGLSQLAVSEIAGQPSAKDGLPMAAARRLPGEPPAGETHMETSEEPRGPGVRSASSTHASDRVPVACASPGDARLFPSEPA